MLQNLYHYLIIGKHYDSNIANVRDNGNLILVIIKLKIFVEDGGTGYKNAGDDGFEVKIVGDGTGEEQ